MDDTELCKLIPIIEQSAERTRFDIFYYLIGELETDKQSRLEVLLFEVGRIDLLTDFRDAKMKYIEYGKSMGAIQPDASELDHLMFNLGRIEHFSQAPGFGVMGVPNYFSYGKRYWSSVKKELQTAICTSSSKYAKDKKDIEQWSKHTITLVVPMVMVALSLPPTTKASTAKAEDRVSLFVASE